MLKRYLNKMIGISGYELKKLQVPAVQDLRSLQAAILPLEAAYRTRLNRYIVDVPIDMIVPTRLILVWIAVLKAYEANGRDAARDILRTYFEHQQPVNAAQFLKLPPCKEWHHGHPLSYVYPWEDMTPNVKQDFRINLMRIEAGQNGLQWQESDGWKGFGPVSERLIGLEVERLTRTFDSIRKNGLVERHGHVLGTLFCAGNLQMVQPRRGWHRVAVYMTLGMQNIPVMFDRRHVVVRLEDAESWPNVRRGLFSLDEAVKVFDDRFGAYIRRKIYAGSWLEPSITVS